MIRPSRSGAGDRSAAAPSVTPLRDVRSCHDRTRLAPAPLVTVRGDAQLEGPPDLATLALTLHASGDTAERTRASSPRVRCTVTELLQGIEAAIERSSTSGVHVAPVFNRRTPAKIIGYQGTFTYPDRGA